MMCCAGLLRFRIVRRRFPPRAWIFGFPAHPAGRPPPGAAGSVGSAWEGAAAAGTRRPARLRWQRKDGWGMPVGGGIAMGAPVAPGLARPGVGVTLRIQMLQRRMMAAAQSAWGPGIPPTPGLTARFGWTGVRPVAPRGLRLQLWGTKIMPTGSTLLKSKNRTRLYH